jgi:hypothetical protein
MASVGRKVSLRKRGDDAAITRIKVNWVNVAWRRDAAIAGLEAE